MSIRTPARPAAPRFAATPSRPREHAGAYAGTRLALVSALAACARGAAPPRAAPHARPAAVTTAAAPPATPSPTPAAPAAAQLPPEVEAMVATRAALRAVEYDDMNEVPPAAVPLVATMRQQMRAWVLRAANEAWAAGRPDALRERLAGPLRAAGLGPYVMICDRCEEPDDVHYGSLVRLDVIEPAFDSVSHPYWVVVVGLSVGVNTDDAVYVFDAAGDDAPRLALAWEQPRVESMTSGRGFVTFRLLPRPSHPVLLVQATHQRSWSRWQWMSWTLVTPTREEAVYSDSVDVQGACGPWSAAGYGSGPWLDPQGLTVMGCSYHRARNGDWGFCERTVRFRWAGERLVRSIHRERCE